LRQWLADGRTDVPDRTMACPLHIAAEEGLQMKLNFLTGVIGTALILAPLGFAQQQDAKPKVSHQAQSETEGVREAIAFQRAKDRADARQARLEAIHPSVDYSNADRQMDDSTTGNRVKDPGPAKSQTIKR
jgi:hypothetical protein